MRHSDKVGDKTMVPELLQAKNADKSKLGSNSCLGSLVFNVSDDGNMCFYVSQPGGLFSMCACLKM